MLHRRSDQHAASQHGEASAFDRFTLSVFMLAVTGSAAVVLGYGPAAALHHIADVLASASTLPVPDAAAWSGQMAF